MSLTIDRTNSSWNMQFAPLAAVSARYQHHRLLAALETVDLEMKSRDFTPVDKLEQVLVSILAGCASSKANRAAPPRHDRHPALLQPHPSA